jgi:hypothetical protein
VLAGERQTISDSPGSLNLPRHPAEVGPRAGSIYLIKTSTLSSCSLAIQFWVENILISKHGSLWTPEP